jgi:hypothetical protein
VPDASTLTPYGKLRAALVTAWTAAVLWMAVAGVFIFIGTSTPLGGILTIAATIATIRAGLVTRRAFASTGVRRD